MYVHLIFSHCVNSVKIWSFSRVCAEYENSLCKSPQFTQMLENRDLKKFRIRKLFTQYHAFYAVHFFFFFFSSFYYLFVSIWVFQVLYAGFIYSTLTNSSITTMDVKVMHKFFLLQLSTWKFMTHPLNLHCLVL